MYTRVYTYTKNAARKIEVVSRKITEIKAKETGRKRLAD